jgi:hypothetical protein
MRREIRIRREPEAVDDAAGTDFVRGRWNDAKTGS